MSGTLEELISVAKSLEGKIDQLIAQGGLSGGAASSGAASEEKPKTGGRKPKEDKPAAKYTADQVKTKFDEVKEAHSDKVPALKKIIADQGYATLAELLTDPSKFDSAYAALEAFEAAQTGGDDADDL